MKQLFRVYDTFQKKYVFTDFSIIGEVTVFGGIEQIIQDTAEARKKELGYTCSLEAWNDFIIEQAIGRKYPDGKEIYIGDRLRGFDAYENEFFVVSVIFDSDNLMVMFDEDNKGKLGWDTLMHYTDNDIRKVGTIHD